MTPETYDPFTRGPFPVGVETQTWTDAARERTLTVEIWYPCTDAYVGQDLDPAAMDWFVPGWAADGVSTPEELVPQQAVRDAEWRAAEEPFPLVLLIHGWAGFRRESTFLGTHLASHGYVVVSPDVGGTTFPEVDAFLAQQEPLGDPEALLRHARDNAEARVGDIPFLISESVVRLPVRDGRVGVTGASFGGYSSLVSPTADSRVSAIAAMCPANDDSPIVQGSQVFNDLILAPWLSDPATMILAADRDSLLPLYGQLTLAAQLPASRKRVVSLARADHNHFVDDIELGQAWMGEFVGRVAQIFPEGPGDWPLVARSVQPMERLVPGETAKRAWQGAVLAHFHAWLRDDLAAREAIRDMDTLLSTAGVETHTYEVGHA